MQVTKEEMSTFHASECSDSESIGDGSTVDELGSDDSYESDSDDDASIDGSDDESVTKKSIQSKPDPVKESEPQFAIFTTDSSKPLLQQIAAAKAYSFAVHRTGKSVPAEADLQTMFSQNTDYSVVHSSSGAVFRAIFFAKQQLYAVMTSVAHDNAAVQKCVGKQTPVRKTEAMCEYSLNLQSTECPTNLQRTSNKLGISKGGIFFSTDNANAYIAKLKATSSKKRKATSTNTIEIDGAPVRKPTVKKIRASAETVKTRTPTINKDTVLTDLKLLGVQLADSSCKHTLQDAIEFLTSVHQHTKFGAVLAKLEK